MERKPFGDTPLGRDPYVSALVGFHMDIELDSDGPLEDQERLLDAAQKGCFVEATMRRPSAIIHGIKTADGRPTFSFGESMSG